MYSYRQELHTATGSSVTGTTTENRSGTGYPGSGVGYPDRFLFPVPITDHTLLPNAKFGPQCGKKRPSQINYVLAGFYW